MAIKTINLKESVKPISYFKANTAKLVKYVNDRKTPVVITQKGEARAILMDIETYQNSEDAFALINLLKLAEKEVENGNVKKPDEVVKNITEGIVKNAQKK
jgi:prevent-host-death family protein